MNSKPVARLHIPSRESGSCFFGAVERDTRPLTLTPAQRFNYYPATPMASISWIFSGSVHFVEERRPTENPTLGPALPRLLFSGPQSRPSASWAPSPVHAIIVGFYPEALGRILGVRIESYLDQFLPLSDIASTELLQACEAVFNEAEATSHYECIERKFEKFWALRRGSSLGPSMADWLRSLTTRANYSNAGRSIRQFQRLVRRWTGQSHRDLQLYARVEDAYIRRQENKLGQAVSMASLAIDAGYADQSHMGREIRRVTGLSPAKLDELIANDEAFWYYRLIDDWVSKSGVQRMALKR